MEAGKKLTEELFPAEAYKERVNELKRMLEEIGPSFEGTFKKGTEQAEKDLHDAVMAKEIKFDFNNDAAKKGSREFNDLLAQVANRELSVKSTDAALKQAGVPKEILAPDKQPHTDWVDIKGNTGEMVGLLQQTVNALLTIKDQPSITIVPAGLA